MVTARDGRPTRVTRMPLTAPPTAPTTRATPAAAGNVQCDWVSRPMIELESPIALATERSISPVMMMSVIGRAISSTGAMSSNKKL